MRTPRSDSRANQRAMLIGTLQRTFHQGQQPRGLHKQVGHMKATVRNASHKKSLAHRGRPNMNQRPADFETVEGVPLSGIGY